MMERRTSPEATTVGSTPKARLDDEYYGDSLMMAISADEPDAPPLDTKSFVGSWHQSVRRGQEADTAAEDRLSNPIRAQILLDQIRSWVSAYDNDGHLAATTDAIHLTSAARDDSSDSDLNMGG
jgi:hypothetical protein